MSNWGTFKYKGMPLLPGDAPSFGDVYFVTNATGVGAYDGNTGLSPNKPKATIQGAITAQIANTQGFGDRIYVLPGTYAENVYAASLSNVSIIGVGADLVSIEPVAGHGLQIGADGSTLGAEMTNVALKGITFQSATTTNTEYAAVNIVTMTYSVIEDCKFLGGSEATYAGLGNTTIGLQIGDRTGAFGATYELHRSNRISRCIFGTGGGRTWEFTYGLIVGDVDATSVDSRGFTATTIEDSIFACYDRAIEMNTGAASCGMTVIRKNIITSNQGGNGPNVGIESNSGDTDLLCMVVDNRITAINDCINGFSACNCQGNIVSAGGATPDTEYQDS